MKKNSNNKNLACTNNGLCTNWFQAQMFLAGNAEVGLKSGRFQQECMSSLDSA